MTRSDRMGHQANFDALRLLFAALVIFAHSFNLLGFADPLESAVHRIGFGALAVAGFFLISGYLITQSWIADPSIGRFLARRALRIYPAFVVASLVSVFIVGPLGSDPARYFHTLDVRRFLVELLTLRDPRTPPVFAGTAAPFVNGSMWTISFEFRCYLLAMVCGLIGLFRWKPALAVLVSTLVAFVGWPHAMIDPAVTQHALFGIKAIRISGNMMWFASLFLVGAGYCVLRAHVRYRMAGWLLAAVLLYLSFLFSDFLRVGILLAGSYFIFAIASARSIAPVGWLGKVDLSYGMYLYGFPVQKLLSWYLPGIGPWVLCSVTLPVCALLAWLSWRLIEQPALKLKPRKRRSASFPELEPHSTISAQ